MRTSDFDYELPPELIAQVPLAERDASRLLVLDRADGSLRHRTFRDLPEVLAPGDLVVVNRSRVFPARLLGTRRGGGRAEVLLLRPLPDPREWEALLRPARRLTPGDQVEIAPDFRVTILSGAFGPEGRRRVRLESEADPWSALERLGHVPLPPYIARADGDEDKERYQTVFARERGSVAAPTAGLHFTPELLRRLAERGVERAEIVLHVGPGTFRPVKAESVEEHRVDPERYELPSETATAIERTRARGGRVVAVGTTTVRTLESAVDTAGAVRAGSGETDRVIVPGSRFAAVDALVTNFHLPRSSLLLLVSAFAGRERILDAYEEAKRERYRFYSYGDAMLIL